ncbi:hypothetical protein BH09MYX1_BH09MYX1_51800 [soil metagenome]
MKRRTLVVFVALTIASMAGVVACSLNPQPLPPGATASEDGGFVPGADAGTDASHPSFDAGTQSDAARGDGAAEDSGPTKDGGTDGGSDAANDGDVDGDARDATDDGETDAPSE